MKRATIKQFLVELGCGNNRIPSGIKVPFKVKVLSHPEPVTDYPGGCDAQKVFRVLTLQIQKRKRRRDLVSANTWVIYCLEMCGEPPGRGRHSIVARRR
jgi:hypothetical protein